MTARKLLCNWALCPDGVMLPSTHVHDFRTHNSNITINGEPRELFGSVDGGREYQQIGGVCSPMPIYEDDPFDIIRRFLLVNVAVGKSESGPHYIALYNVYDNTLLDLIKRYPNLVDIKWYQKEMTYRKYHDILIKDENYHI